MYIHHLNFCQLKQELRQDTLHQTLLLEIKDYVALKHVWGRSEIHVIRVNDFFIYGFFGSRLRKDKMLLGFDYKEVLERVLRYYVC